MSSAMTDGGAGQTSPRPSLPQRDREAAGPIRAVPVPHPWRWAATAVIALLAAMFINMLLTNPAFDWDFIRKAMQQAPVLRGFMIGTVLVTVCAMVLGVVLGIILAVMRVSSNPVLNKTAFAFIWFFRGVPRLVLLTLMGALGVLFQERGLIFGVPFDRELGRLLGLGEVNWTFLKLDANEVFAGFWGGVLGLGLSEAAYMAEIARSGIQAVDRGQTEAAQALGMSPSKTMRRVVLPQAMRVIVPPTGNETISMFKDTSLLVGLPFTTELFFQLRSIGSRYYEPFNVMVAAILFYLLTTSLLMVAQHYLERRFGRGFGTTAKARPTAKAGAAR